MSRTGTLSAAGLDPDSEAETRQGWNHCKFFVCLGPNQAGLVSSVLRFFPRNQLETRWCLDEHCIPWSHFGGSPSSSSWCHPYFIQFIGWHESHYHVSGGADFPSPMGDTLKCEAESGAVHNGSSPRNIAGSFPKAHVLVAIYSVQ